MRKNEPLIFLKKTIANIKFHSYFRAPWRILIGAMVSTLITNILCLSLWTDYDVAGFIRTPFNTEARMEILYAGALTGADAFAITSSEPSLSTSTNYSYVNGGQLYTVDLPIGEEWKPHSLALKARKKGNIRISLKGPQEKNDYGEIYSIPVDYRNLRIRDKEIFSDRKKVTHTKCFAHQIPVNANDTIKISFDVRRHHFDADDFNLIKTKNFWYIITLSIFVFAISYNLLQRAFAMWKMGKVEGCCFLFAFFSLLAVPLCNISDAQKAHREGRALTPRPSVSLVLKEGSNYGKRYDNWFCDHLGGREWLIKLHDALHRETQRIIRTPQAWYMKDNGWIFSTPFTRIVSQEVIRSFLSSLVQLREFCERENIKFYVMVIPHKNSIYQEKLYGYGLDKGGGYAEKVTNGQMHHLASERDIAYIYPWTELREACKQDYTFFKLTHHWTDWGAYVGYRALMKEIRRDFSDIPIVSLEDYKISRNKRIRDEWHREFNNGFLGKFFNFDVDWHHPPTLYNYYNHRRADKLMVKIGDYTKDFVYGGGAYKIMLFGDSQSENLLGYLSYSAAMTRIIRLNRNFSLPRSEQLKILKYYRKDILSYKPDILIFLLSADRIGLAHFKK